MARTRAGMSQRIGSGRATPRKKTAPSPGHVFGLQVNFGGKRVNVEQVGLGTNSTFMQNLAGEPHEWDSNTAWLMETVVEKRAERITGVGVEPVEEHLRALLNGPVRRLPRVALVQAALGEVEKEGACVHALTPSARDVLMQKVPRRHRMELSRHLECLLNMSCIGQEHPYFGAYYKWIRDAFGVEVKLASLQTDIWSYGRLAGELNFRGCELLIVDTEGHDAMVLRSMIKHCLAEQCSSGGDAWPDVIQFETMGHCDRVEGWGTEWAAIEALEGQGYILIHYSHCNTQLDLERRLETKAKLEKWVSQFTCCKCQGRRFFPYISDAGGTYYCSPYSSSRCYE